jgi:hypothetical protein
MQSRDPTNSSWKSQPAKVSFWMAGSTLFPRYLESRVQPLSMLANGQSISYTHHTHTHTYTDGHTHTNTHKA